MLGAAPTKAAALITSSPLAAAALLVTGTFAWRSRLGLGGQVLRMLPNEMRCLAGVEARDQAAVELQVSFVLLLRLYSAHRCAAGTYPVRTDELIDSALLDRIRSGSSR